MLLPFQARECFCGRLEKFRKSSARREELDQIQDSRYVLSFRPRIGDEPVAIRHLDFW